MNKRSLSDMRVARRRQATHIDSEMRLFKVVNGVVFKYVEQGFFMGLKYPCWSSSEDSVENLTKIQNKAS